MLPVKENQLIYGIVPQFNYSSVPNRCACSFISGKVCLLSSIDAKRQTLPEINVQARLFGTLENVMWYSWTRDKLLSEAIILTLKFQDFWKTIVISIGTLFQIPYLNTYKPQLLTTVTNLNSAHLVRLLCAQVWSIKWS